MGYEVRLHFVVGLPTAFEEAFLKSDGGDWYFNFEDNSSPGNVWLKYGREVSSIDLGKVGSNLFSQLPQAEYYLFESDGDTPVVEDRYGSRLKQASLFEMRDVLEREDPAFRQELALDMINCFIKSHPNPSIIKVLVYGH